MAAIFTTSSMTDLLERTSRLNLTVHPKKGHQGQDELRIVGEDFSRVVRSDKQWDRLLTLLETTGKRVSKQSWGVEEDALSGMMLGR
mgnify:CR=1 FL=1